MRVFKAVGVTTAGGGTSSVSSCTRSWRGGSSCGAQPALINAMSERKPKNGKRWLTMMNLALRDNDLLDCSHVGWHALRYSEGRGCTNPTPFGVPQGVPPIVPLRPHACFDDLPPLF